MQHVIAVLAFAAVCGLLYGIQHWAGGEAGAGCRDAEAGCRGCGEAEDCPVHERADA
jgi:hypothetical protein